MKKLWAIACVIGYAAFWTFGFLAISAFFGDRPFAALNLAFCIVGLALGIYARAKVVAMTPKMHGRRAAARARLEEDYNENPS